MGVHLGYLATYKLSQDHLELFFATVRRRGGNSHNPTPIQFMHAYRAILCNATCAVGISANVLPLDDTETLASPPLFDTRDELLAAATEPDDYADLFSVLADHDYAASYTRLSTYVEDISEYIGGYVARKILKSLTCIHCKAQLVEEPATSTSRLLHLKNNGGLTAASRSVVAIVHACERAIRLSAGVSPIGLLNASPIAIEITALSSVNGGALFKKLPGEHVADTARGIACHPTALARMVATEYIRIRRKQAAKQVNQEKAKTVTAMRKLLQHKHL
jgi:hypothetical protein